MGIHPKLTTYTGGTTDIALETVTRAQSKTSQSYRATTALQRTGRVIIGLAFGLSLCLLTGSKAEATTFSFTKIADTNTPIPRGKGNFIRFGVPSLDKGDVAFTGGGTSEQVGKIEFGGIPEACLQPGVIITERSICVIPQSGIYTNIGSSLNVVADLNTAIPGGTGNFTDFFSPSFDKKSVAFVGLGSSQVGIYINLGDQLQVVADRNTDVPGSTEKFSDFARTPSLDKGTIAFLGYSPSVYQGIYSNVGGSLKVVADTNTAIPGGTGNFASFSSDPSLDKGTIAFVSGFESTLGIYTKKGDELNVVVDNNTAIPGGTGNFEFFQQPSLDKRSVVFYGGKLGGDFLGIYTSKNGFLKVVADTNTAIPGGTGNFTNFGSNEGGLQPALDHGNVAFIGSHAISDSASFQIFQIGAYTNIGGELTKIIARNDSLDGKIVSDLSAGSEAISGKQIAFKVLFTDGSQAIYIARATSKRAN